MKTTISAFSLTLDEECECLYIPEVSVHPSSTCGTLSTIRGPSQKVFVFTFIQANNRINDQGISDRLTFTDEHFHPLSVTREISI